MKVYSIGLYIEQHGARLDRNMLALLSLQDEAELRTSTTFYDTLLSRNSTYDRTLRVKFLMNVKAETMWNSMIEDLYFSQENKVCYEIHNICILKMLSDGPCLSNSIGNMCMNRKCFMSYTKTLKV